MTYVKLEIDGAVGTLRLNRPPVNLLDLQMVEEINDALLSLRANKDLKILVFRGGRDCFSDGFDLDEFASGRGQRLVQMFMRIFESLRMMDVVQIAAIEGRVRGAGWELVMGCNISLAAQNAVFCLPETSYGLFPAVGTAILPRIAPRRKAMEWILTGNPIPATELHHHGIMNRLLDPANFDRELQEFIAPIANKSRPVLALARRAQFEAYYATFPDAVSRTQSMFLRELLDLDDAKEGMSAYREGREPNWNHR